MQSSEIKRKGVLGNLVWLRVLMNVPPAAELRTQKVRLVPACRKKSSENEGG